MSTPRHAPLTVGQMALGLLPLAAALGFGVFVERLPFQAVLSFVVLALALSAHLVLAIRGRANTAADASVFIFFLLFLLVAPIVQFLVLGTKLVNTAYAQGDLVVETNLACALFIGFYLLMRATLLKPPVALPARWVGEGAQAAPPATTLFSLTVLTGLCAFITLISIPLAGATGADHSVSTVLLAFRKFLFFIPTAVFLLMLAEHRVGVVKLSFVRVLLLLALFACVMATQNPGTEKRNALGPVYLAILFLLFQPWLLRKAWQTFWLALVLLFLFPFSSLFTHVRWDRLTEEDFSWEVLSEHFVTTHYDAWANVYTTIEMVQRNGLSAGRQLGGALLFYVPSNWWGGKPLATGIEIGNFLMTYYTMWFNNLSAPLVGEGFIDFGYIGVLAYAAALAWLVRLIERMAGAGRTVLSLAVAVYLSFFLVFLLRGSLMIAVAYGSGALAAFVAARLLIGFSRVLGQPGKRLLHLGAAARGPAAAAPATP